MGDTMREGTNYVQRQDREGFEIPSGEVYRLACCDCGLVHDIVVMSHDELPIGFAASRNETETRARRASMTPLAEREDEFWRWLPLAYRLKDLEQTFTVWNMEVAFAAGRQLGMEQARAEGVKCARHGAYMCGSCWAGAGQARREPLSELRINQIAGANEVFQYHPGAILEFVRDIEAAHGIPTPPAGDSDTQS